MHVVVKRKARKTMAAGYINVDVKYVIVFKNKNGPPKKRRPAHYRMFSDFTAIVLKRR